MLAVLGTELVVLVVTGVALYFLYRPSAVAGWNDRLPASEERDVWLAHAVQLAHHLAAWLTVATAVAAAIVMTIARAPRGRRVTGAGIGAGIVVAALGAFFTGLLLPWDQLALWAVTVGSDLRGYKVLFEPTVRFVIMDNVELDKGSVVRWLLVHVLVLSPALAGLLVLAWRRSRA